MDKTSILKKLFSKKTRDYTYTTIFLFIFSFFVAFIIRPNLNSVFEKTRKIEKLKNTNQLYEEQIEKIIEVQSILEENRDNLVFLDDAISKKPQVNKVLSDLYASAQENSLASEKTEVSDVNLKQQNNQEKIKSFVVKIKSKGEFEKALSFVQKIYMQRRLKLIENLAIGREEKESTSSSALGVMLDIEGFYL